MSDEEIYRSTPVIAVIPGDLHLTEPDLDNVRAMEWVAREVNDLIRPDFVQFIGDNVQDATDSQFKLFGAVRDGLQAPHFALVGDHDVKGDPTAAAYRRHVGEPYGSISLRGFRFIRLNTQECRPLGLSVEQVAWFAQEVDQAFNRGQKVVVFQHNYPFQIWEDFYGSGIDAWRAVVQSRRIEAIVCGHTHYWQVANDGKNVVVATRSIGDPEGGPPGYTLLYLSGDDLAIRFRPIDELGPALLVTHPRERLLATSPRHIVRGPDFVRVRVWSESDVLDARYRIDGGASQSLQFENDGHWGGPLAGDELTKGAHELEVVVVASDGARTCQVIEFVVDATGRYTAVPEVRPAVASTAFC
jgi:predicted phosphodiesterase